MPEPLIELTNVGKSYGDTSILDHVSLAINRGRITMLIGPNGAGKTTLVKLLLGLVTPNQGTIKRSAALQIGYMPQKLQIDSTLPLSLKRFLKLTAASAADCRQALATVGIESLANHPVQQLSGGEFQRALLARALLRKPNLLVLDEPVQGVDLMGQEALYQLITQLRDELNCAVLMVSHDLHLVMAATDEVICLNRHVCCHGSPGHVATSPAFIELFGEKTAFYTHDHDHKHNLHGDVVGAEKGTCSAANQAHKEQPDA